MDIFLTTYCLPITLPKDIIKFYYFFLLYPHFPHNIYIKTPKYGGVYPILQNYTQGLLAMLVTFCQSDRVVVSRDLAFLGNPWCYVAYLVLFITRRYGQLPKLIYGSCGRCHPLDNSFFCRKVFQGYFFFIILYFWFVFGFVSFITQLFSLRKINKCILFTYFFY